MKRAINAHRKDVIAIVALVAAAIAVVTYVLRHQPAFTFGQSYYTVYAQFSTGAAVTGGQGQPVAIAGVPVGLVGGVKLQDGLAVVTMNIDKKYAPIYRNATVLLRPRTPLKDMFLSLDPGTPSAGALPAGGTLGAEATNPDIDFSEILNSLDVDTRNYLLLLLSGGAEAFRDPGYTGTLPSPAAVAALQGTFKRFAPLGRDTQRFATLLSERNQNIRRAIHNLGQVATSLGGVESQFSSLITSSNTNFSAISSQDANLEAALSLLPGTLQLTNQTLGKVQTFANQSGTTLQQLLPFARAFGPGLKASQPLFRDTTPVIQHQLRPFSVAVQPLARVLEPASTQLAKATPPLTRSFDVLNDLFNTLAYQPRGSEQGYLFWGSWLAHIADSLTDVQDAQGPIVRSMFMGICSQLSLLVDTIQHTTPPLSVLIDLLNLPNPAELPNTTTTVSQGVTQTTCL